MKRIFLAVLMAGVASSALAADLPTRKAPSAPAPSYYQPAFTWTGFYLGVNGGFGYGSLNNTNFANPNGGMVGGTAGYNYQMGQFVVGLEGDLDWADMKRGNSFTSAAGVPGGASSSYKINTMLTARARVGYAIDRTLLFITGGYAGMDTHANISDAFGSASQDRWRSGGVIGGGIEYAFTNNISLKGEYLWAPMQAKSYWSGTPYAENNRLDVSMFRAGLNYKF